MHRLSRRQLLISLIFPVGITVWAVGEYVFTMLVFGAAPSVPVQWGYLIAAVLCGVIPIILTVTLGIDTGQYILPRTVISGCALVFTSMAGEFLVDDTGGMNVFFLIAFNVFSALYFYKIRPTKFSEWIVIFLSNPCLVRLIEFFSGYLTVEMYF